MRRKALIVQHMHHMTFVSVSGTWDDKPETALDVERVVNTTKFVLSRIFFKN